jgi:hypothetical protein
MPRYKQTRGYPITILVGLERNQALICYIYSESVILGRQIQGEKEFSFVESSVDILVLSLKQGI